MSHSSYSHSILSLRMEQNEIGVSFIHCSITLFWIYLERILLKERNNQWRNRKRSCETSERKIEGKSDSWWVWGIHLQEGLFSFRTFHSNFLIGGERSEDYRQNGWTHGDSLRCQWMRCGIQGYTFTSSWYRKVIGDYREWLDYTLFKKWKKLNGGIISFISDDSSRSSNGQWTNERHSGCQWLHSMEFVSIPSPFPFQYLISDTETLLHVWTNERPFDQCAAASSSHSVFFFFWFIGVVFMKFPCSNTLLFRNQNCHCRDRPRSSSTVEPTTFHSTTQMKKKTSSTKKSTTIPSPSSTPKSSPSPSTAKSIAKSTTK